MKILQLDSEGAGACADVAVVIDVLRAFTTAPYAFSAGAERIVLVNEVEEAFQLRAARLPGALLVGEVGGHPIPGFDLGNSPAALRGRDLSGKTLIFRTSSGTAAAQRARAARVLLVASFVCARATLDYLRRHEPSEVGLIQSGRKNGKGGDDDGICAEYMAACLENRAPDWAEVHARLMASKGASRFQKGNEEVFPLADLELAGELDRFDFAMRAQDEDGLLTVRRV